jgi:hypothetical protein
MNEQSLRGQLKLFLIEYFDGIQFEIDIQAQKLLEKLEDGSKKREDVLKMNLKMVDKVKEIHDKNSKAVDDYFNSRDLVDTNNLEELKAIIFNGFCLFYSKEENFWLDTTLLLGILIVTDWYLDQNQMNYLKCLFLLFLKFINSFKF